jgi:hypothetical protein
LRGALKKLFEVLHQREQHSKAEFQRRLQDARADVLRRGLSGPPTRRGQNMAKRFRDMTRKDKAKRTG